MSSLTTPTRRRIPRAARLAAITAAIVLPLGAAACGADNTSAGPAGGSTSAPASSPSMSAPMSPSPSTSVMSDKPFGPACSAVPTSGKGSFDGMSSEPVATAASNNPVLSTLVTAVKKAGLVDTLNTAEDITVFAPTNDAFADLDSKTLKKAMGDPQGLLTDVLTAHVVSGRLAPDQLAGEHQSLNPDQMVTVTGSGENFEVNGQAMVVCGNVQTANATVYIIDQVLLPKS
ncbi:MAG: fasciclin domain-containing protein [Microlunatus sp.]|nr:fasciclin domain-containing protein [Microlunatus sp.]MDN5770374.1 fasciclin domain-containing protein [Microlunatus sp.]